jgi:hypothetical protein
MRVKEDGSGGIAEVYVRIEWKLGPLRRQRYMLLHSSAYFH